MRLDTLYIDTVGNSLRRFSVIECSYLEHGDNIAKLSGWSLKPAKTAMLFQSA